MKYLVYEIEIKIEDGKISYLQDEKFKLHNTVVEAVSDRDSRITQYIKNGFYDKIKSQSAGRIILTNGGSYFKYIIFVIMGE